MPKKGELTNIKVTNISSDGRGVGRYGGQAVFVKHAVPGDELEVRITKSRKKLLEGSIVEIKKTSVDRTDPFCSHFGLCGGCKWQHMTYEAQLAYKHKHVSENLSKLSGISSLPDLMPIVASQKQEYYRNKLEYTFSNNRWFTKDEISSDRKLTSTGLGFHIPKRFDKILNIDKCFLQADPGNEIRVAFKAFADEKDIAFFDLKKQTGFLRNLIIRNTSTGDLMVILQVAQHDADLISIVMDFLKKSFPQITSLLYVVNTKGNETFHDLEVITYKGKDHIVEQMGKLNFKIGPKSFYQTNSEQAHRLCEIVATFAGLEGKERVYDLYTGIGTIANYIASSAKKVIGLEYVAAAIEDAKENSRINTVSNTEFYAGDMKDLLNHSFISRHGRPDVIITDPPRAGMHEQVVNLIRDLKVDRLVYVSCNPATQARDMRILDKSYEVKKMRPIDMFPHTQHVENVVLMKSRK